MLFEEIRFKATGGFDRGNNLTPEFDSLGEEIIGYRLPDGRFIRLVIALEVESKDGTEYTYITSEKGMEEVGLSNLAYDELIFQEGG